MTEKKALEILKYHNAWRRGEHDEYKHTAEEIGQAMDVAINRLETVEYFRIITENTKEYLATNDDKPSYEEQIAEWNKKFLGKRCSDTSTPNFGEIQ